MKILLIYNAIEESEKRVLNTIKELLLKFNHTVVPILGKDLKIVNYNEFSLALIYNSLLTKKTLKTIETALVPKILILEESKIFHSYISQPNLFDKIILLKDRDVKITEYLPRVLTEYIHYPLCPSNKETKSQKVNERFKIFIAFNSNYADELLIRIAPVINHLSSFDYKIVSKQKKLPKIFNDNITLVSCKSFNREMEGSDLVIGNGFTVLEAILSEKPVIVIGDNGFGGLVKSQMIETQYQKFFSGRIGGEIDEKIPAKFLIDDILRVLYIEEEERQQLISQNKAFLEQQQKNISQTLNNILLKVVNDYSEIKNNLMNCQLIISKDFELIPFFDGYVVSMIKTNYSHSLIDKESFEIIKQFKEGNKVITVMKETNNINEENEFKNFIVELLTQHILTIKY